MPRSCFIRSSSKNISSENYNSKKKELLDCYKPVYRNDQYGQNSSVNASVKIKRTSYNTIINNVNNAPDIAFNITPYVELSNTEIYEYLKKDTPISSINMVNARYYYTYSCNSKYFYIIDNILYSKQKFIYDKQHEYHLTINATKCVNGKSCEIINRNFVISIINTNEIQDVLNICDIKYKVNDYLLSYLSDQERSDIKILKNLYWNNYYNNKIIKKNHIVDTSFINDHEQMYQIIITTTYLNYNNEMKTITSIFDKRILNTLQIVGETKEGSVLYVNTDNLNNDRYAKYNNYYWWIVDSNNNYKILNNVKTSKYTIRTSDVGKKILASIVYRDNFTIVLRNISVTTNIIENIDNIPIGTVNIVGSNTVGKTFTVYDNISDLDGISSKTLTWYKSKKDVGVVNTVIYEWQKTKYIENTTPTDDDWSVIEYSNHINHIIPIDKNLIGYIYRIKATVYDVYGNSNIFYSNNSNAVENITEVTENNPYKLTDNTKIGETIKLLYNGSELEKDENIKYVWYRSYNKTDWNSINTNYYLSHFTIPISQETLYTNEYLKVTIIKSENDVLTYNESSISNIIVSYDLFKNGTALINGKPEEGSTLSVILNIDDTIDINDYNTEFIWETTKDKIIWTPMMNDSVYSLQQINNILSYARSQDNNEIISKDNKSMKIPSNGDFIHSYIRCKIILVNNKNNTIEYLLSNTTSRINNTDRDAVGTITLDGTGDYGSTVNAIISNLTDYDGAILSKSYQWQYNELENSTNWVDIGTNNSHFDIPTNNDLLDNKDLRVIVTTIDSIGGSTNLYSNSIKIKKVDISTNNLYISGDIIEGSQLSIILSNTLDKNKIIKYNWKYSYDKINNYNIINVDNKNTFTIPTNNTYIGKYILVEILYNDNNNIVKYTSSFTDKIIYLNNKTEGILLIQGIPKLGQELYAKFEGLFDQDTIVLDDNNEPHREKKLELTESSVDFKYRASISYTDNYGMYNIIYSEYTDYVTDIYLELEIPDQPCSFFTDTSQYEFTEALDSCRHVIIGVGGSVYISEDLVLKGGFRIVVDGGLLNFVNCNFEILNYGQFVVQNGGLFTINGNLIINEHSIYIIDENTHMLVDKLTISNEPYDKCNIITDMYQDMFLPILHDCNKVNIKGSGNVILNSTLDIDENKTIVVNKHASLSILNCDLHIKGGGSLYIYGIFILTGSITIEENGIYYIDNNAIFCSDGVGLDTYYNQEITNTKYIERCKYLIDNIGLNSVVITTTINITELNSYFKDNYEITLGTNGKLIGNTDYRTLDTLIINNDNSLVVSENAEVELNNCKVNILTGGTLDVKGKFTLISGELVYDYDSTVIFAETSIINVTL